MPSKSVLIVITAVLAVAVVGLISVSSDSDAAPSDFGLMGGYASESCDSEPAFPEHPSGDAAPVHRHGHMGPADRFSNEPLNGSAMLSAAGSSATSSPSTSAYGPMGPGADGMRSGTDRWGFRMFSADMGMPPGGPGHHAFEDDDAVIVVIDGGSSSIEDVIEQYEQAYYEKSENSTPVIVVDDNDYAGDQADIVDAMKQVLRSSSVGGDFLVQVMDILVSENKTSSADAVKDIVDRRFFGFRGHHELVPDQKYREEDADEDDMNSEPVYVDESEEEDDAPVVFDAPILMEAEGVMDDIVEDRPIRLDYRYSCGVI